MAVPTRSIAAVVAVTAPSAATAVPPPAGAGVGRRWWPPSPPRRPTTGRGAGAPRGTSGVAIIAAAVTVPNGGQCPRGPHGATVRTPADEAGDERAPSRTSTPGPVGRTRRSRCASIRSRMRAVERRAPRGCSGPSGGQQVDPHVGRAVQRAAAVDLEAHQVDESGVDAARRAGRRRSGAGPPAAGRRGRGRGPRRRRAGSW